MYKYFIDMYKCSNNSNIGAFKYTLSGKNNVPISK